MIMQRLTDSTNTGTLVYGEFQPHYLSFLLVSVCVGFGASLGHRLCSGFVYLWKRVTRQQFYRFVEVGNE